uniref:C2H2-type domain-containing protein n=1 Tax=Dicentrarchus labrax TaxID=13489 RepID=A0A8P4GM77_DICLA
MERRRRTTSLDGALSLFSTDVQLLLVRKEEVPPQQQRDRSPSLDQVDPSELPLIKEELWTSQEGDQTEEDTEDCGGPEPARNFNPDIHLQPETEATASSEPETAERVLEETQEPQSGLNLLENKEAPLRDLECNSSSGCATSSDHQGHLQTHNDTQTKGKPFSCSICGESYSGKNNLMNHMRSHSKGTRFNCSFCRKTFTQKEDVVAHMKSHVGEKPFSCFVCGKRFTQISALKKHSRLHTEEQS